MHKWLKLNVVAIAALLVAGLALAQEPAATPAEVEPWVCPEGYEGQQLNILNWSTYIAEDTIPNFEAACGVTVVYDTAESSEAMLARIRQGNPGYSIIVPAGNTIGIMVQEGLLTPLNKDLIPNFANLDPALTNPSYDPDNLYSIPYQWGTIGIGYNKTVVTEEITSWSQFFAYDGEVALLDDRRAVLGIALNLLGYDPNTTDAAQIEEAKTFLLDNGGNVKAIAADDGQAQLLRGDVDMTIEYNGDIIALADECECEDFVYVVPEEGSVKWVDNMAIPFDAPNAELAMVFMDYILHPQVGADISNYTAYASPQLPARELGLIDPEALANTAIYPSAEIAEKLFDIVTIDGDAERIYNDSWDELLIFLGQ